MRVRIKFCGITNAADAAAAIEAGADALGFVFHPPSPRYISPVQASEIVRQLPAFVSAVGLFVNLSPAEVRDQVEASGVDTVQFHGDESPEVCAQSPVRWFRALRVKPGLDLAALAARYTGAAAVLLDAWDAERYGGSGKTFDWREVEGFPDLPTILAGGLTPENVGLALATLQPYAVDVSSGIEAQPGIKDHGKMRQFAAEVEKFECKR